MARNAFPPIRLREFRDIRIRRPVLGTLDGRQFSDHLLTEPVPSQLKRWMEGEDHFILSSAVAHRSTPLPNEERAIVVWYVMTVVDRADAVHHLYGG